MAAKPSGRLSGKVALVTGGGRGIGRAICQLFAAEGAYVVVTDVDDNLGKETLSTLQPGKHIYLTMDVSKSASVTKAFQAAEEAFPKMLDIVVNCAGILRKSKMEEVSEEEIDAIFGVNVKGSFLVTREAAKHMGHNDKKGAIIHLASVCAHFPTDTLGVYSASKAAVVMIAKSAALELAPRGIRCNAIAPGVIQTPMLDAVNDGVRLVTVDNVPYNRVGTPMDVANLAFFLASDESDFITGAVVQVSGGCYM